MKQLTKKKNTIVAVIGAGTCEGAVRDLAHEVGRILALNDFDIVCGGLGGVMEAAAQGASEEHGRVIGVLPGLDASEANEYIETPIVTGLGHMRNFLVIANADIVLAIHGSWGTLSELALAKKIGKTVVAIGRWSSIEGVIPADTPEEAIELIQDSLIKDKGRQ